MQIIILNDTFNVKAAFILAITILKKLTQVAKLPKNLCFQSSGNAFLKNKKL